MPNLIEIRLGIFLLATRPTASVLSNG